MRISSLFAAVWITLAQVVVPDVVLPGPVTSAVNAPANALGNLTAPAVPLNATGDQGSIAIPAWVTAYHVTNVWVSNCTVTPILAQFSMFTGAGGTGSTVVTAATITGATSSSVILPQTLAGTIGATRLSAATLFIRVAVANAAALTCDVHIRVEDWS